MVNYGAFLEKHIKKIKVIIELLKWADIRATQTAIEEETIGLALYLIRLTYTRKSQGRFYNSVDHPQWTLAS